MDELESVDINSEIDFLLAETLMEQKAKNVDPGKTNTA
jgi:hypothetical protein